MAMKMATVEKAEELLEKLSAASWSPAVQDMDDLNRFAKDQSATESDHLTDWDMNFWSENLRESNYDINEIRFASVDLQLHTKYNPDGPESVYDVDHRVCEKAQVIPPLPEDRFLCSFSHIFAGGYAAGYYSYKAVKETGHRFPETILALGGGKDPLEVFIQSRGREPSPEALLRHNGLLPAAA